MYVFIIKHLFLGTVKNANIIFIAKHKSNVQNCTKIFALLLLSVVVVFFPTLLPAIYDDGTTNTSLEQALCCNKNLANALTVTNATRPVSECLCKTI